MEPPCPVGELLFLPTMLYSYDGKNLFSSSMKIKEDYIITFITDCLPSEVMISVQLKMF